MTVSPLDMVTPAQPPTDGGRELLAFTAVAVVAYVFGACAIAGLHFFGP